jgi:transketolase
MVTKSSMTSCEKTSSVLSDEERKFLKKKARDIRINIIKMIHEAGSGHPGGSLSVTDILVSLYFYIMNYDPHNPVWPDRDWLILSKGHAAPALYANLAEAGFFDKKELMTLRKTGSKLQGHPDRLLTKGVEMSTGSLGQGLSVSTGVALGARIDGKQVRVFTVCSDGEHQSGMTWEAVLSAAKFKLDNLTVFIDKNGLQIDGKTKDIMPVESLKEKYTAFNWKVFEADGHDFDSIISAARKAIEHKGMPSVIICDTVKGKGVSFMENVVAWHGVAPNREEMERAVKELESREI